MIYGRSPRKNNFSAPVNKVTSSLRRLQKTANDRAPNQNETLSQLQRTVRSTRTRSMSSVGFNPRRPIPVAGYDPTSDESQSPPTETFAISASFITANAATPWFTSWAFNKNGSISLAEDRNGVLSPGGKTNPTLNFHMGDTIRFENVGYNSTPPREDGQRFFIKNDLLFNESNQASGVVNNGSKNGSIFFTPESPGTYYYVDVDDFAGNLDPADAGKNYGLIIIS